MKGLIIKHLCVLKNQMKTLLLVLAFFVIFSIINEDGEALGLKQIEENDDDTGEPLNEEVNITKINVESKKETPSEEETESTETESNEENIIDVENELSKGDEE